MELIWGNENRRMGWDLIHIGWSPLTQPRLEINKVKEKEKWYSSVFNVFNV